MPLRIETIYGETWRAKQNSNGCTKISSPRIVERNNQYGPCSCRYWSKSTSTRQGAGHNPQGAREFRQGERTSVQYTIRNLLWNGMWGENHIISSKSFKSKTWWQYLLIQLVRTDESLRKNIQKEWRFTFVLIEEAHRCYLLISGGRAPRDPAPLTPQILISHFSWPHWQCIIQHQHC